MWRLPSLGSAAAARGGARPRRVASARVPGAERHSWVRFCPHDGSRLVTNGRRCVTFWRLPREAVDEASSGSEEDGGGGDGDDDEEEGASTGAAAEALPGIEHESPPVAASDLGRRVGGFLASVFAPPAPHLAGAAAALTSTTGGDVVVWEEEHEREGLRPHSGGGGGGGSSSRMRAVKAVRLHEGPIPFLGTVGSLVATGGADGLVRLFDAALRLAASFEDLRAGPIACVSFSTARAAAAAPPRAATELGRLVCPDFCAATAAGAVVAVVAAAAAFNGGAAAQTDALAGPLSAAAPDESVSLPRGGGGASGDGAPAPRSALAGELMVETRCQGAVAVAAHPSRAEAYVLAASGEVQRWDLRDGRALAARAAPPSAAAAAARPPQQQQRQRDRRWWRGEGGGGQPGEAHEGPERAAAARCLEVAPDGSFVAVGCASGHVRLLDAETLEEIVAPRDTGRAVCRLAAAAGGRLLAAADAGGAVLLYMKTRHKGTAHEKWEFVGRAEAHNRGGGSSGSSGRRDAPIVGLVLGGGRPRTAAGGGGGRRPERLFSLCSAGLLVEYDLAALQPGGGLRPRALHAAVPAGCRAAPTALCFAPPLPGRAAGSGGTLLLIAGEEKEGESAGDRGNVGFAGPVLAISCAHQLKPLTPTNPARRRPACAPLRRRRARTPRDVPWADARRRGHAPGALRAAGAAAGAGAGGRRCR